MAEIKCPKCDSPMVIRTSREGNSILWMHPLSSLQGHPPLQTGKNE